jgi:lysophospholipase L1-like esterase
VTSESNIQAATGSASASLDSASLDSALLLETNRRLNEAGGEAGVVNPKTLAEPVPRVLRGVLRQSLVLVGLAILVAVPSQPVRGEEATKFLKRVLDTRYYSEGIYVGDINGDEHLDLVCGPQWFEGPAFASRHPIYEGKDFPNDRGYSNNFFSFVDDIDGDGAADILTIGLPGTPAYWYENPGTKTNGGKQPLWKRHIAFEAIDNESPAYTDLTGDGRREIVCSFGGKLGYVTPTEDPRTNWRFVPCSAQGTWHRYTHGLGVGDVDGDGRPDLLTSLGWWQQPKSLDDDPVWKAHHHPFSRRRGGGQMFATDVDGDEDADVITSLDGHGWGFVWHEQIVSAAGERTFRAHRIMGDRPGDNRFGVAFSQLHALDLADIDGDGLQDIVTGKCYWAHNGADPGARDDAVTYAFLLRREKGAAWFEPHQIDDDSGVGRQIVARDVNGDGRIDIVTSNKKGVFVFEQQASQWPKLPLKWHSANTPVPRPQEGWRKRQDLLNERARSGEGQLLFIGDSITQGWEGRGKEIWQEFYGDRRAINLGISGDRTQHVLWRLQHGNTDNLNPKACVLMIGTNNAGQNSGEEIADGVLSIVRELRFQVPQCKILILAVFPRGADATDARRKVNEAANVKIAKFADNEFADNEFIHYLDIGSEFLGDGGGLAREIMPDLLHLSEGGYRIWAESIESKVKQLLAE